VSIVRFVALGDSFTEGVGDSRADGSVRGWADRVAEGLALHHGEIEYANLAIRGRLLDAIIEEQLPAALALQPTLLSFNGGGNDMLRPGTNLAHLSSRLEEVVRRVTEAGVRMLLVSGANPTAHLPSGGRVQRIGDQLNDAVRALTSANGITYADNWSNPDLTGRRFWDEDRLHLNPWGHRAVASHVLRTLEVPVPAYWTGDAPEIEAPGFTQNVRYTVKYVLPWIGRRLTGRSSGDGRTGKYTEWVRISAEQFSADAA